MFHKGIQYSRPLTITYNSRISISHLTHHLRPLSIPITGGLQPFCRGVRATVYRDISFGGLFALIRHGIGDREQLPTLQRTRTRTRRRTRTTNLSTNFLAAGLATAVSSPFNYVRNVHYNTKPEDKASRSCITILLILWKRGRRIYVHLYIPLLTPYTLTTPYIPLYTLIYPYIPLFTLTPYPPICTLCTLYRWEVEPLDKLRRYNRCQEHAHSLEGETYRHYTCTYTAVPIQLYLYTYTTVYVGLYM